jgi:hypothetical protein
LELPEGCAGCDDVLPPVLDLLRCLGGRGPVFGGELVAPVAPDEPFGYLAPAEVAPVVPVAPLAPVVAEATLLCLDDPPPPQADSAKAHNATSALSNSHRHDFSPICICIRPSNPSLNSQQAPPHRGGACLSNFLLVG